MLNDKRKAMIKSILKDPYKKNIGKILYEFLKCSIYNKEIAWHYFTRALYRKDVYNYLDYISFKELKLINSYIQNTNTEELAQIFKNKILFYKYCIEQNIKIPNTIGWNSNSKVTIDGNIYDIKNENELRELLKSVMDNKNINSLIVKPAVGTFGKGCKIINDNNINQDALYKKILENSYVFQEVIIQHPKLYEVYPGSLNTIRMDTYADDSKVSIISAFINFGINGNIVDNPRSGGCFIPIDMKSGKMKEKGRQLLEKGGKVFFAHPDTGIEFKDRHIPYFGEVKELVTKATEALPFNLIGWDIGISKDGPVIIEGNCDYDIHTSEMAYGGYKKHPVFHKILNEYI